jgi:hypothetical protein
MKCPTCKGCFEHPIVRNERYLYCWLCNKYYYWDGKDLFEVTKEILNGENPAIDIQTGKKRK